MPAAALKIGADGTPNKLKTQRSKLKSMVSKILNFKTAITLAFCSLFFSMRVSYNGYYLSFPS